MIGQRITTVTCFSRPDTEFVIMNAGEPEAILENTTHDPVVPSGENLMHVDHYKGRIVPGIVSRAKSGGRPRRDKSVRP